MTAHFDWSDEGVTLVCQRQAALAVYIGNQDHLVLRQEADDPYEDDAVIVVEQEHAVRLAETILRVAGYAELAELFNANAKRTALRAAEARDG